MAVHLASPGMVATDLLAASAAYNPRAAGILNILAEEPRTVARWLAPRMRVRSRVSGPEPYSLRGLVAASSTLWRRTRGWWWRPGLRCTAEPYNLFPILYIQFLIPGGVVHSGDVSPRAVVRALSLRRC